MSSTACTLEQDRARDALQRVRKLAGRDEQFRKRYRSYVERLGPAIVTNGLGQAMATERAAAGEKPTKPDEEAHFELYHSLRGWLCRPEGGVYPGAADLLQAIVEHDEALYLRAQAEALAWLEWHKKFCRSEFPKDDSPED